MVLIPKPGMACNHVGFSIQCSVSRVHSLPSLLTNTFAVYRKNETWMNTLMGCGHDLFWVPKEKRRGLKDKWLHVNLTQINLLKIAKYCVSIKSKSDTDNQYVVTLCFLEISAGVWLEASICKPIVASNFQTHPADFNNKSVILSYPAIRNIFQVVGSAWI